MLFASVSVFRPPVSSLAAVFLLAQLSVIARLLWRCQLLVCARVCVRMLHHHPCCVVCIFMCVANTRPSLRDYVSLTVWACALDVCAYPLFGSEVCLGLFIHFNGILCCLSCCVSLSGNMLKSVSASVCVEGGSYRHAPSGSQSSGRIRTQPRIRGPC